MITIDIHRRPYERNWSGNPIPYRLFVNSTDPSLYFDVRIHFRRVGAPSWDELPALPYYPVDGIVNIDLRALLDTQLAYAVPPASGDQRKVHKAPTQSGEFYISYRWVLPSGVGPWIEDEQAFVLKVFKGGINYNVFRGNNFWLNYFDEGTKFLTWQERGRLAGLKERMYLAYMINDDLGPETRFPRVRVYFTDGTFADRRGGYIDGLKGEIFYIPSGAEQWNLAGITPVGKQIHYWEVCVAQEITVNNVQPITEVFSYFADNRNSYNDLAISYRNSLGGLDSIEVRGEIRRSVEYSFDEVESVAQADYYSGPTVQRIRHATNNRELYIVKGDIGYMGREAQDRMRDMSVNRELWEEQGGKWIPLHLTTKSFELESTSSKRWSMPFEFQKEADNFYTPAGVDLGDGQFTNNISAASVYCNSHLVAFAGADMTATLGLLEIDPYNDSTMIRYRIEEVFGSEILPWTERATGNITFTAPKDKLYLVQVQCYTGPFLGRLCQFYVDGRVPTPAGGGSVIINATGLQQTITLSFKRTPAPLVFVIDPGDQVRFNAGSHYASGFVLEMSNPPASVASLQLLLGGINWTAQGSFAGNKYTLPDFFGIIDNLSFTIS
ncbi:MAG: hypothetical protein EOP84_02060 [Verrucomicrobiaceae bacterium]|nr:MAG: hypothetical protein EOP84_02060 [Verrucomicrobiaceae bacterium]